MNIGSRPAKRVEKPDVEACARSPGSSLDPEPFPAPSWYGAGTALSSFIGESDEGLGLLKEMCTVSGRSSGR